MNGKLSQSTNGQRGCWKSRVVLLPSRSLDTILTQTLHLGLIRVALALPMHFSSSVLSVRTAWNRLQFNIQLIESAPQSSAHAASDPCRTECEELGLFALLAGENCGLHLSYYRGGASSCTVQFTASSSVNLVEEIHELLKIYFVIRFNPSYLDHC